MIEITVEDVLNSVQPMSEVIKVPMPAQTAYRLGKLARLLNEEIEPIQNAIKGLREKYIDPETGELKDSELEETYAKELDELLNTTVKIAFTKIDINVLGPVEVTPGTFMGILWAFTE